MKPGKAFLFFLFCLVAVSCVGTSFSHLWRTNKERIKETNRLTVVQAPPTQTNNPLPS